MSEYEAAALAVQHATLSLGYWQVGATLAVGLVQCALIAWGVSVMKGSNVSRDATLAALQQQGEALQQQGEAFQHQQEALQRQGAVLADIGAGIRELLKERAERPEAR